MTEDEYKELREKIWRYQILQDETTDPLAACLLEEIVFELEADLTNEPKQ